MITHVIRSIMVPSLLCTFVAHIIFLHVFFLSPFPSLSLSLPPSFSLSMSLCGCKTCVIWCSLPSILFLINLTFHTLSLHRSYKIHQPFTDYLLRLPSSELLEKDLFRSRANRRLVYPKWFPGLTTSNIQSPHLLPVRIRYRSEGQAAWRSPPEG